MHDFSPLAALAGGALIGLASSCLLLFSGRVAGISGMISGLFLERRRDRGWRALFLSGLLLAGLMFSKLEPSTIRPSPRSIGALAMAGLLVGIGTRLGSGCTSGHGVCGVSRLSPRSLVATLVFVAVGMLTVGLVRWTGGGS